jgi:hypothetical protein
MLLITEQILQTEDHNTKLKNKIIKNNKNKNPAGVSIGSTIDKPGSVKSDSRRIKDPA